MKQRKGANTMKKILCTALAACILLGGVLALPAFAETPAAIPADHEPRVLNELSGNAAFMRNWPYAWALAQGADSTIKGKVGIAPLPKGGADGRNAGTLGGQLLAVSKYSKNADAATDEVDTPSR